MMSKASVTMMSKAQCDNVKGLVEMYFHDNNTATQNTNACAQQETVFESAVESGSTTAFQNGARDDNRTRLNYASDNAVALDVHERYESSDYCDSTCLIDSSQEKEDQYTPQLSHRRIFPYLYSIFSSWWNVDCDEQPFDPELVPTVAPERI
jgi:hypothetical protein